MPVVEVVVKEMSECAYVRETCREREMYKHIDVYRHTDNATQHTRTHYSRTLIQLVVCEEECALVSSARASVRGVVEHVCKRCQIYFPLQVIASLLIGIMVLLLIIVGCL